MCVVVVREGERYEVSSQGFVVRGREGSTKNEFSPAGHQRRKGGREVERDCCCVGGFKEEEKKAHAIPAKVIQAHRRRRRRRAFPAELEVAVRKPLAPMLEKRKQQQRRSPLTAPSAAAAAEEEEGRRPLSVLEALQTAIFDKAFKAKVVNLVAFKYRKQNTTATKKSSKKRNTLGERGKPGDH